LMRQQKRLPQIRPSNQKRGAASAASLPF